MFTDPTGSNGLLASVFVGLRTQPASWGSFTTPVVRIDRSHDAPLRLNSGAIDLHGKSDAPDSFSRIKNLLVALCDPWSRTHLLFIERYFSFIEDQCEHHRGELNRILEPFGSVYDYRDYRFSAWLPLPLACLSPPAILEGIEAPVRMDFLFWSGSDFIAVELCGHASRSRRRDTELRQLRDRGVRLVEAPIDILRGDSETFFVSTFPRTFSEFWLNQPFPSGPRIASSFRFSLDADDGF